MSNKDKKVEHHRDAETGRYVTEDYAQRNPKTTVKETDKIQKIPQSDLKKKK